MTKIEHLQIKQKTFISDILLNEKVMKTDSHDLRNYTE